MTQELHMTLPPTAGRAIAEAGSLFVVPLCCTNAFVHYCKARGLSVTAERLAVLERLGWFGPLFRVKAPGEIVARFRLPITDGENWFVEGWAWDTTIPGKNYRVPESSDESQDGYYSIFQIDELDAILDRITLHVQLDWYFENELEGKTIDWNAKGKDWLELPKSLRGPATFNRTAAFLCQFISERYYPHTQSDGRMIQCGRSSYFDPFLAAYNEREWRDYARAWEPGHVVKLFGLTKANLRNMYEALAVCQAMRDPIESWYQLVHFVSVEMKRRLKGDALHAETTRSAASMLRMLYKDLFAEELPNPNEVTGQVIVPQPELEVRRDTRRFLEFVANRFHVNPQPIVALFVEGETEKRKRRSSPIAVGMEEQLAILCDKALQAFSAKLCQRLVRRADA